MAAVTRHTPQQRAVINAGADMRSDIKCASGAGVGKTEVLREVAHKRPERGLYLVFNTALQKEAQQSFPAHINCRTGHSIAYQAMNMRSFRERLVSRLQPRDIVQRFGLRGHSSGNLLAWRAAETLRAFCRTTDRVVAASHARDANLRIVFETDINAAVALAATIWDDVWSPQGRTGICHDFYLKQFYLSNKPIPGAPRYILFDEAQDADPVVQAIVRRERVPTLWVGDRHQQLYRWRGAVNAMRAIEAPEYPLMVSFRFGQMLANVANFILSWKIDQPEYQLEGWSARRTIVEVSQPPGRHALLCRTNAGVFEAAAKTQAPLHIVGGFEEVSKLVLAAWRLWKGETQPLIPDLSSFPSWTDLTAYLKAADHDPELSFLVRMVDTYGDGLPELLEMIESRHCPSEADATVVLSTVHRFKGRQAPVIVLGDDFPDINDKLREKDPDGYDDELNILYVAATRAIDILVVNATLIDLSQRI